MRKTLSISLLMLFLVFLAACSGQTGTDTSAGLTDIQEGQNQLPDMTEQPIEMKLAMGTLKLEGTDQAVTAEEAKTLLTLWKAVKALNSDSNTSSDEMNGLYAQIQEAMAPEQVQAIKDMSLTMEDTQALMNQYGVEMSQQANPGSLSEEERATRIAEFQAQRGGNSDGGFPDGGFPGGGFPGGGFQGGEGGPPGDFGGDSVPGGTQGERPNFEGTPSARMANRGFGGGFNFIFVDPLIKLLEQRAAE